MSIRSCADKINGTAAGNKNLSLSHCSVLYKMTAPDRSHHLNDFQFGVLEQIQNLVVVIF